MKKIYIFIGMLLCSAGVWGQVLTENFSYTAGTLLTANGWTAHSGAGTNSPLITTPSLTYASHPGSGVGNAVRLASTSGEDDNRTFTAITSGTAYASFLVNVNTVQATGDYFIGLLQNATTFPIRIYARTSGAGFNFGLSKSSGAITYEATVRTLGTTYLIATNYIYNAGVNDDVVNLWVNPTLGAAQPAATIANVTGAVADATTLSAFYVRQGTAANAPTQSIDAILVGTTWADVTPTVGGTPNIVVSPTSLSGFTALSSTPSAEQFYTVSGTDLTADIVITPPAGFEISPSTAPFVPTNPINLTPVAGSVPSTPIYVRMNSATLGVNTGNITHTSTGATTRNVTLTGNVLDAEPTVQSSIIIGAVTNSTVVVNFAGGNGARRILVARLATPVNSDPVDGTTYTANANFGSGTQIGTGNYVVYDGIGNTQLVTGLTAGATYHFAIYEYNDGGVAGAENYLVPGGLGNATLATYSLAYVWIGLDGDDWQVPTNWTPFRLFPATNDSLIFLSPLSGNIVNVPTQTVGNISVSLSSINILHASAPGNILTIGDLIGNDLTIEAGSSFDITGANALTLNIVAGANAVIDGSMTFTGTASNHRLIAADPGSVVFNNGAVFTAGTGFLGNAFGTTNLNSIIFASGSIYDYIAGSNPFGAAVPNSVVTFQPGSLFRALGNNPSPSFSGRTYANVQFAGTGTATMTGGSAVSIDTLIISSGIVNINMTGTPGHSIKGIIDVAAGATLNFNGAGTMNLNGTAAQSITNAGTLSFSTVQTVNINNAAGITLNSPVTISGPLNFTSGLVNTTATNLLTMAAGSTVTGASNASFVFGPVKKIGNTNFTFPVGKANGYVPIGISNFQGVNAATDEFTAEYIRSSAGALGTVTDPLIDHVSACDYWTLNLDNGTPTVDVTAYWNANNPCAGPYITNLTSLALVHFNGVNWNTSSVGFHPFPNGTIAAGDITWPSVTTFSPFSIGSTNGDNPLPIIINSFTGAKQNAKHLLNWQVTCVSTPSVTIELERSTDGRNYSSIYSIFATELRCQQPFNYTDNQPASGVNYYRLKMINADGKITYSSTVSLINAVKGFEIMNIAPNPIVNGAFNLRISSAEKMQLEMLITDMQGRVMQKQSVNMIAGFNSIPVNVRSLAPGTYQVYGNTADGRTKTLRFVIQ